MLINGTKIRELRKDANMTLEEVAVAAGISFATLSYIESGKKTCSVEVLYRIAHHFGLLVDDLIRKPLTEKA